MGRSRFDIRLKDEEKQRLKRTAHYFRMSVTDLLKNWILHGGPEGFLEWERLMGKLA